MITLYYWKCKIKKFLTIHLLIYKWLGKSWDEYVLPKNPRLFMGPLSAQINAFFSLPLKHEIDTVRWLASKQENVRRREKSLDSENTWSSLPQPSDQHLTVSPADSTDPDMAWWEKSSAFCGLAPKNPSLIVSEVSGKLNRRSSYGHSSAKLQRLWKPRRDRNCHRGWGHGAWTVSWNVNSK